jgi:hypothetical protein
LLAPAAEGVAHAENPVVGTRCGRRALGAVAFLLAGGTIGLTYAATYAAAVLVCRFERGGMKRAWAATELLPASATPLGFGACGGGGWNRVGRGRWGAGGRVRHRRPAVGIWRCSDASG